MHLNGFSSLFRISCRYSIGGRARLLVDFSGSRLLISRRRLRISIPNDISHEPIRESKMPAIDR